MIPDKTFSQEELRRYSRQFSLNEVGLDGQKKLKKAKVLCIGAGGLGSPVLLYLAAAGVGTLGIVDADDVDLSNLHRQILFNKKDIDRNKANAAEQHLCALNPNIDIICHEYQFNHKNALEYVSKYDIVVDATDNFTAKYLINDACCILKKENVYASIFQFEGQCAVFSPAGPCYRCFQPTPPTGYVPNCAQSGVIGSLAGMLGTIQATEVIKLILNVGAPLRSSVLTVDALTMEFKKYQLHRKTDCITCGNHQTPKTIQPEKSTILDTSDVSTISIHALKALQKQKKCIQLLDVREPFEHEIFNIGGTLIPLNSLQSQLETLNKTIPIVIYCASGQRSLVAAKMLKRAGFDLVKSLKDGIGSIANQSTHYFK